MAVRLEQLLVDAARRNPGAPAVRADDGTWTYGELDAWSSRLAAKFADLGVGRGDRVAVWAPKSCRAVAALQAALRVGAPYVPIDPMTPPARAHKILEDCDVRLTVTTRALGGLLGGARARLLLDDPDDWPAPTSARAVEPLGSRQHDLAYILYTSGSTGAPKGVCISHRNALAFVEWAGDAIGITSPQVFANHASFNFDLSVFDLYGAFLSGSVVCLVPEAIAFAASKLAEFITANRISIWYSVPSALILMMEHGGVLDGDRHSPAVVIFAGEPFPVGHLRRLRTRWRNARMFNFYGPTETNVCTSYEVVSIPDEQVLPVPIGSAASADRVWAVKADGTTAGAGEEGELYIDGPTVMLGYWGADPHRGPYRSGDICVLRPDGHFEFVGRRDQMVKHRGHRIELGEIEAVLNQHPNVSEVAVVAVGDAIAQRLVAFVVPRQGRAPTLLELKAFAAHHVPPYMLVDRAFETAALPRTSNGKVDRLSLGQQIPSHSR